MHSNYPFTKRNGNAVAAFGSSCEGAGWPRRAETLLTRFCIHVAVTTITDLSGPCCLISVAFLIELLPDQQP